ncbi:terminase small subunit [Acinetobacter sp. NyZ410]|uniref:terminase small subunit n=1 Tax=Acinetobacter sp. NyZ410 TaxID=2929509 RepID=UPI001FB8813B|nr:terminase small subunit [Acinetobacter sp. NyZ410]UOH17187.1 terminase small subunit [Acinetobacter sp. NyZ410]
MEDIELPKGSEPLANQQHENLAQAYVETANKKKAGEKAGYTDKSNAFRAILRPDVQERIKFLQEERAEELGIDAYYVLKNLKSIAERCMQGEQVTDRDGSPVFIQGPDEEYAALYKFDQAGANKSLEMIGKHLGMFKEEVKLTGNLKIQAPTFNIVGVKPDGDKDTV